MKRFSTKWIVYTGMMTALVFLGTYLTRIPTPLPGGYFNLGDAVIMVAAIVIGRSTGLVAGAVGSFLSDTVAFGFLPFAPITFVVKGIEGYVIGVIASRAASGKSAGQAGIIAAVATGAVIMVAGYFFAETYVLSIFNSDFGLTAAVSELVPNLIQGGLSAVVGYVLSILMLKFNVRKYILS